MGRDWHQKNLLADKFTHHHRTRIPNIRSIVGLDCIADTVSLQPGLLLRKIFRCLLHEWRHWQKQTLGQTILIINIELLFQISNPPWDCTMLQNYFFCGLACCRGKYSSVPCMSRDTGTKTIWWQTFLIIIEPPFQISNPSQDWTILQNHFFCGLACCVSKYSFLSCMHPDTGTNKIDCQRILLITIELPFQMSDPPWEWTVFKNPILWGLGLLLRQIVMTVHFPAILRLFLRLS
jgi:hypothetical protein